MKFTNEHIQQLLIEKVTGVIGHEDDLAIEQLLVNDKLVYDQWQEIVQQIQQAELKGFSLEGDAEKSWHQIAPLMEKPKKAKVLSLIKKIVSVAAILAAIFSGVYLFNKNKTSDSRVAKLPVDEKQNAIKFSIDNGETVYLQTKGSASFKLGSAAIETNEAGLTYSSPETKSQQWGTLAVPSVLDYKIRLSDGTEVWMNSETKLRFPLNFSDKTREVYIDGEAYFKVAKNVHQPFIVHTPKTEIKVLGTQFNVNTYDDDKIVTALVEGAVTASDKDKKIELKPGFEAVYNFYQKDFQLKTFDDSEVLAWMNGVYYFHNMPLQDLSKLLSRWYNVQVEFEKPALRNKTFSGELVKNQPVQLFLDNIKISNEMNSDLKDGVVRFK